MAEMDMKEKLVEIIQNSVGGCARHWAEVIADGLIANDVTVQEWISVKDRLPDVGSIVLVSDNETDCHIWQYTNYSERGVAMPWMDEFGIPCKTEEITHWMPLPQPPKGE